MSYLRGAIGAIGIGLFATIGLVAYGPANAAWAEDTTFCVGTSGTLCRTVQVQTCIEWVPTSLTVSLTGGGFGTTCKTWYTQTWSYYYPSSSGSSGTTTKPGLT